MSRPLTSEDYCKKLVKGEKFSVPRSFVPFLVFWLVPLNAFHAPGAYWLRWEQYNADVYVFIGDGHIITVDVVEEVAKEKKFFFSEINFID